MFRRSTTMLLTAAAVIAPAGVAVSPTAAESPPHPSQVVLDWERTSMLTIYGPPTSPPRTPIPVGVLYLGFVSLAMHDAVLASTPAPRSSEAAAVAAAAHGVLSEYFPASASSLDAALDASLAQVPDGRAETTGVRFGEEAAARMIASRDGDGRGDPAIGYSQPMLPGYWQPPTGASMLAPWLGSVDPLVLDELVAVDGPDPLTSDEYADDYNEVLRLGSADSTERTAFQTDTARFFNSNSATMVGEAVINLLADEPMGLRRTTTLFARMHGSMADSVIKVWQLKRDVGFWRPFQAIAGWSTDGNPDTGPWPTTWVPLIPNPPYSDYVSGHASLTAPAVETLRMMLGEDTALTLHSYTTNADRAYGDLTTIEHEAFHARIWGGLHFRDAMEDGYAIGHGTAQQVAQLIR